jgi:hypothetical protein
MSSWSSNGERALSEWAILAMSISTSGSLDGEVLTSNSSIASIAEREAASSHGPRMTLSATECPISRRYSAA